MLDRLRELSDTSRKLRELSQFEKTALLGAAAKGLIGTGKAAGRVAGGMLKHWRISAPLTLGAAAIPGAVAKHKPGFSPELHQAVLGNMT